MYFSLDCRAFRTDDRVTFSTDVRMRDAISWDPGCSDDEIELLLIQYSKYPCTTYFRPVENICSFSRETVIEITTNIESQEMRRRENEVTGYPEHP